jgi:hypothetical protein
MRRTSFNLTSGLAIFLCLLLFTAAEARAEECPVVEVNCTNRVAGDTSPLHCTANIVGDTSEMNLSYQWSVTPQATVKNIPGRPDEIEIDLSGSQNKNIKVLVTVKGFPAGCENSSSVESLPVNQDFAPVEPRPLDTFSPLPTVAMPNLSGSCAETVNEGEAAYFNARVSDLKDDLRPNYSWTVSRGRIKSGQGTPAISVDTTDLGGDFIKATARVEVLNTVLTVTCTSIIKRLPKIYKIDEISGQNSDAEKERLRRFALRLNIGLDEQAYIVVIGRRGQTAEEIKRRGERVRGVLINLYGVAPERIMGLSGRFGKAEAIQLWVIQNGAEPPKTSLAFR